MSTILFGTAMLFLLLVGIYRRKRQEKEWIKEERYEESGDWLDKRAGERGTYGNLDRHRESERTEIYRRGRMQELIRDIEKEMDWIPGRHTKLIREKIDELTDLINLILTGKTLAPPPDVANVDALANNLKKTILNTCFELFPDLLNADIQHLKLLDAHVLSAASKLISIDKGRN